MSKSNIYTRTGDGGTTALVGGVRVSKCHPRLEAYGTVDELNSHLGLLISEVEDILPGEVITLQGAQTVLFDIGAALATPEGIRGVRAGAVAAIEAGIDRIDGELTPLQTFILPAGCRAACQAHVARTVCRRAERCATALDAEVDNVSDDVLRYLNRLSDYLFVLARALNAAGEVGETPWLPEQ